MPPLQHANSLPCNYEEDESEGRPRGELQGFSDYSHVYHKMQRRRKTQQKMREMQKMEDRSRAKLKRSNSTPVAQAGFGAFKEKR